jgi:hypothetical protein
MKKTIKCFILFLLYFHIFIHIYNMKQCYRSEGDRNTVVLLKQNYVKYNWKSLMYTIGWIDESTNEIEKIPKNYVYSKVKKMCRVSVNRLFIYNFAWGLLKTSNSQAESKILKKIIGKSNLSIKTKNFKKKTYLKSGKRPKICPDRICRPEPKS